MTQEKNKKEPVEKRAPEGFATAKARKRYDSYLNSWYGTENGQGELVKHLPNTQSITDVLGRVSKRIFPAYLINLNKVKAQWPILAGERAAKFSRPSFLAEGILNIEVMHAAYRSALEAPEVKKLLLSKVQEIIGEDIVKELRFIPAGRRKPDQDLPR